MMKLLIIVVLLVISFPLTKTTRAGETPLYPHS
ncbi:type I toxin-antitoxin system Ibs family toxin [Escherichia coli]|nr:type I toxin-antitoxin system Ibs family toxin [Escherichia coli]EKY6686016.1 type I toxin-antitoxin system Ibs family toxin [Escherichia coli]